MSAEDLIEQVVDGTSAKDVVARITEAGKDLYILNKSFAGPDLPQKEAKKGYNEVKAAILSAPKVDGVKKFETGSEYMDFISEDPKALKKFASGVKKAVTPVLKKYGLGFSASIKPHTKEMTELNFKWMTGKKAAGQSRYGYM